MTRGLNELHFFRLRRNALLWVCLLLLAGAPQVAAAAIPLMPVEEIRVGAQGIARTVIEGYRIEDFGVEVLGIMKNKGAVGDLILVRTYGDVIDRAGGVAQGNERQPGIHRWPADWRHRLRLEPDRSTHRDGDPDPRYAGSAGT